MPRAELSVAEALAQAQMIDSTLAAWEETAPNFVASVGGRDALARECEMTCIGPVPRLDVEPWQRACLEWWERREAERGSPYYAAPTAQTSPVLPGLDADVPPTMAAERPPKRGLWGIFTR